MKILDKIKAAFLRDEPQPETRSDGVFTYTPPLELKPLNRGELTLARGEGVWIEPPAALRTFKRRPPAFHDDPDNAGLFSSFAPDAITYPPGFIISAEKVRQIGYRCYITHSGRFFNDQGYLDDKDRDGYLARLSQTEDFPNEDTGLVASDKPGQFTVNFKERTVEVLSEEIISLCSSEPSNYGAFLFRVLPKLAGAGDLISKRRVLAPVYTPSMRELLKLSGLADEQIIPHNTHVIYEIERALIPSNRNIHAFIDHETLAFYAKLREQYGAAQRGKRIFVSRMGWAGSYAATHRVMVNEAEVAAALQELGFEIVRTHDMSILEQIEIFSSASIIVGASGSAMYNVLFSHPGTKLIDIESEPHWIFAHTNLFSSCGLDYGIFEGRGIDPTSTAPHKPFSVNIDALIARVKQML
ncbi:glycosyltransferase family 61 protein [Caballeronia sp. 15711]|uniref:glycosyltransferase family 61 protein n=1 Tax=Caballeronia sp. 15711 TaxID=3391029 RepID=UPI0039E2C388